YDAASASLHYGYCFSLLTCLIAMKNDGLMVRRGSAALDRAESARRFALRDQKDREIREATRALLFRLAQITPIEPSARVRGLDAQDVWRLDEVRAVMIDALQNN